MASCSLKKNEFANQYKDETLNTKIKCHDTLGFSFEEASQKCFFIFLASHGLNTIFLYHILDKDLYYTMK